MNDEAILLDPATSKFFMLNRTSAFIWEHLSSPATAKSLASAICGHFSNAVPEDVEKDVGAALEDMLSMDLVVVRDGT